MAPSARFVMRVMPRMTTATDGAAENRTANRLGWPAWPRSEKARTARPPIRAFQGRSERATCYNSDIKLQVCLVNIKEGRFDAKGCQSKAGATLRKNQTEREEIGTVRCSR